MRGLVCLVCVLAVLAGFVQPAAAATTLEEHVVKDTVTPSGIVLNLFDYWVTENQTDTDTTTTYADVKDSGINKGHALKFNSVGPGSGINQWTGNSTPRSNVVQTRLSGGYPRYRTPSWP